MNLPSITVLLMLSPRINISSTGSGRTAHLTDESHNIDKNYFANKGRYIVTNDDYDNNNDNATCSGVVVLKKVGSCKFTTE